MAFTSYGVSPAMKISAENLTVRYYNKEERVNIKVKPPLIGIGGSFSEAMEKCDNPWAEWNACKITEPKYDGISGRIGYISNQPDFIQDKHIIGLMRLVSRYIRPEYKSNIHVAATSPDPKNPPAPANI
jgi:hypothetical protein